MTKFHFLFLCFFAVTRLPAQGLPARLDKAVKMLELDARMKHGLLAFYVVDAKTGSVLYDHNGKIGLAVASSQKVITSAAAFELLGADYRYKTEWAYDGSINKGILTGDLYLIGSGDPSLGSWRWNSTQPEVVWPALMKTLGNANVQKVMGNVILDVSGFTLQPIPGGWIWDDIGNHYGAGVWGMNWHENQYDIRIAPGKEEGDGTTLKDSIPGINASKVINEIKTGKKGSGDNGYIYLPPYSSFAFTSGTIPAGVNTFSISGSLPDAPSYFNELLRQKMRAASVTVEGDFLVKRDRSISRSPLQKLAGTYESPALDSLNYLFLKKSINLYGEALVKTIAFEKTGLGSTDAGVEIIRDFWAGNGIDKSAIHIIDGSGLSPQNRVTAASLVQVMQYARSRPWYKDFYNALPEINNIRMKSGSISGARSFTGYTKTKTGQEYSFAIIANNYDGSAGDMVRKMYTVLDNLK